MTSQGFFEKTELVVPILTIYMEHPVKNRAKGSKNKQ